MPVTTLRELFEHELKDVYYAEQKLVEALQQLAGESTKPEIRRAFEDHRKETQNQIKRLEQVFSLLGQQPETEVCAGIEGLLKEKQSFSREKPSEEILQVFNLGAAQKTERYEITAYENLIELGRKLQLREAVQLFNETLTEEKAALQKLQALAKDLDVTPLLGTLGTSQSASAG